MSNKSVHWKNVSFTLLGYLNILATEWMPVKLSQERKEGRETGGTVLRRMLNQIQSCQQPFSSSSSPSLSCTYQSHALPPPTHTPPHPHTHTPTPTHTHLEQSYCRAFLSAISDLTFDLCNWIMRPMPYLSPGGGGAIDRPYHHLLSQLAQL